MSYIIANATARKGETLSNQEIADRAAEIRRTPGFQKIKNDCSSSWEEMVKYGTKAIQGKGQELVLSYAELNRDLMDKSKAKSAAAQRHKETALNQNQIIKK